MEPITVLIADDPSLFRAGLVSMLEAEHDIKVVGLASEIIEAADKARELKPQVILSDVRLKGYDSLKSMLEIRESLPATAIVILTESEQEDDVFRAFAYGAQGYLLKSCSKSDLVRAVKKAASGEMMLSESIASRLVKELHDRASLPRCCDRAMTLNASAAWEIG